MKRGKLERMKVWVAQDSAGQLHVVAHDALTDCDINLIFNEVGLSLDREIQWTREAATSAEVLAEDFK